jgi:hypothetical protein
MPPFQPSPQVAHGQHAETRGGQLNRQANGVTLPAERNDVRPDQSQEG